MSLLKINEIQVFNGTTVTITATTAEVSADLNVGADLDVTGALTLGTALAIAEGGTGATSASAARTALNLEIGVDVEAYSATNADYADATANFTGTLQNGGSNVLVDTDIGSTVQAYDADTTKNDVSNTFSANQIISVADNANAALRITQTGTGNALVVEDDTNPDSTPFVVDASGRVGIGTSSPSAKLDVQGVAKISTPDAANVSVELGSGATGDRSTFIDFVGDTTYTDYGLRVIRNPGANGGSTLATRGTGALTFQGIESSPFVFVHGPSTERARIDSSGRLLVGTSSALTTFFGTAVGRLAIGGSAAPQVIGCYAANQFGPRLDFVKSRSATVNGQTVVSAGDVLGELYFGGSDGTSPIPAGRIRCDVDGTPGPNDMPGRLVFSTTADGASSPTERMRIDSSGNVGIGTTSPAQKLDVTGNINATGALTLGTALAVTEGGTGVTSLGSLDAADLGSGAATDGYVLTADGSGGAAWEAVSGGGGITDGDKGDITVSSSGTVWTIDNSVVTNAKLSLSANDSNIKTALNASGSAPIYACRAWVNFNGTGTVAIRASGNVSSITDNGTGDYTVNFTNAMPDANYAAVFGTRDSNYVMVIKAASAAPTASSLRVATFDALTAGLVDREYNNVAIFR